MENGTTTNQRCTFEPAKKLGKIAEAHGLDITSNEFASLMDSNDELRDIRKEFCYPVNKQLPHVDLSLINGDADCVYLCGNSLGLMPKKCSQYAKEHLDKWAQMGVHGHMHGERPWVAIEDYVRDTTAKLVGAKPIEVVVMNTLTVNVNLMMVPFYRPTPQRYKILLEGKSFPSDIYAVQSQVHAHGYKDEDAIIEIFPRKGERLLRTEDILKVIEEQGDSIALVMFSGVQYFTGQYFDIKAITDAAHKKGCYAGFDLAHAAGNVELHLHDWDVDYAVWCNYKYINCGAGALGSVFVHEKHAYNFDLPRFAGWWGADRDKRFEMNRTFEPIPGADGFQISNPPCLQMEVMLGSYDIFDRVSMKQIRAKGDLLTAYLEILLLHYYAPPSQDSDEPVAKQPRKPYLNVITPADPKDRGCQLSVCFSCPVENVHKELKKRGVVVDTRKPDVMRIAPAPLYNSFTDVHRFVELLGDALSAAGL